MSIVLVVSGLAAGCMGGDGEEAGPSASAPQATTAVEEPPAPEPPSSFAAEPAPFEVVLTWEPPTEDVERFELFRDGARLATQSGSASSYTDDDVVPGQVYDYQIASATDELVTTRVNVSTETPVPPLRAARLEGTFNVSTRVASKSGYGNYTPNNLRLGVPPAVRRGSLQRPLARPAPEAPPDGAEASWHPLPGRLHRPVPHRVRRLSGDVGGRRSTSRSTGPA